MIQLNTATDTGHIQYMYDTVKGLMEKGVKIGNVVKMYEYFVKTQKEIGDSLRVNYGIQNANSGKQVIEFLQRLDDADVFEECYNEEDGKWTSNKEALKRLKQLGYEFASEILIYRKAKKYAESIKSIMSAMDENKNIHPKVSLTKTNRISYTEPALMNIPKKLLWHIVTPRKQGNVLFSADIKNQEPTLMINILNIEELKFALTDERGLYEAIFAKVFEPKTKAYVYVVEGGKREILRNEDMMENPNVPPIYYTPIKPDVHTTYYDGKKVDIIDVCNTVTNIGVEPILPSKMAISTVDGKTYKVDVEWDAINKKDLSKSGKFELIGRLKELDVECVDTERDEFKVAWNAMTYGASIFGIKKMCKRIDGELLYKYFSKIEGFKKYRSECRKLAKNGINRINTLFRTTMYTDKYEERELARSLMDLPIQGTGADILSNLIMSFNNETEQMGLQDKLMLYYPRHDELIIEADGEWVEEKGQEQVIALIKSLLEHRIDDWEPFKLEVKAVEKDVLRLDEDDDNE